MRPDSLAAFALRTLLWLPACFAAWYLGARYHGYLTGLLARVAIDAFQSGLVTAIEQPGLALVFVTGIAVHSAPGETALLVPEVNPLIYTYGVAFFAALMLASRAKAWKILVGVIALLPFQAWGIAFDFLVQVGVSAGPDVSVQLGLVGWRREAIALGYQLGALIFPTLAPVVLWAAFSRPFMERVLLGARARNLSPNGKG